MMTNPFYRKKHAATGLTTIGQVLEIATFSLAEDVSEENFMAAAEASNGALITLPGFLGRRLAKAPDGTWIDIAEWRDEASAKAAAEVFHKLSQAEVFCSMIDLRSVKMSHHHIVTAG
ncbi:antibiotic biosynthesis monooxygenase family protein [Dongia soli]|uniref:Antibiotic biosynthesis monooxygenase n=1 Tax=Dongia soli TaxID=600628 RepID=A0ABU5EDY8_9PROT|nr:hypothetical protein [Dongia soli]MDY0884122.1 hypothetical protein [Dongia soli]